MPVECITNGEAHVIVRNNADQPVRLNPGALELTVRPAPSLPRIMSPREIEKLGKLSDPKTQSEGEEEMRDLKMESPMALGE